MRTKSGLREVLIGQIGVDSGQVMVCDPCYLDKWGGNDWDGTAKSEGFTFDYTGACQATTRGDRSGGELGMGLAVASSTAWGDGCYEVYQIWKGSEMLRIEIRFQTEADVDGESDDEI